MSAKTRTILVSVFLLYKLVSGLSATELGWICSRQGGQLKGVGWLKVKCL